MAGIGSAFTKTQEFADKSGYVTNASTTPELIIGNTIQLVLSFLGIFFILLVIYGGITWMMAAGEQDKVKSAKSILLNATIGLIIVVLAYAITAFVLQGILEKTIIL
ncbi:MAG: hypothetical protein ACOYMB_02780 [Patescibacteria group bacterium]